MPQSAQHTFAAASHPASVYSIVYLTGYNEGEEEAPSIGHLQRAS